LKQPRIPFAWLAVAIIVATCSTLLSTTSTSAQGTSPAIQVVMGERGPEYYFEPRQITVPTGAVRFAFTNAGMRRHNWVIEQLGQRTPDVDAGGAYEMSVTFTTPGTYQFICDLPGHAARGMTGQLIVTAGAAPAPGTQATAPAQTTPAAQATAPAGTVGTPRPATTAGAGSTTAAPAGQTAPPSPSGLPMFISLAIHIPAAIAWLGVVLYQAIVLGKTRCTMLRNLEPENFVSPPAPRRP
jgi:plastocyanin